jgi:hypothetical protein
MRLEGLHHVTTVTGDAPANVGFAVDEPAETLEQTLTPLP